MLDTLTFKAPLKPAHEMTLDRFDRIELVRNLNRHSKPTINYLPSPITKAQLEVLPTVEDRFGVPWVHLTFKIPVAAVFAGQNLVHGGLEAIPYELLAVRKLVRWTLESYQIDSEDIKHFLAHVIALGCELTWHTETASPGAAKQLQARTIAHFNALEAIKSRHDIWVQDVDVFTRNGCTTLLVSLKDGSQFRQYLKIELAQSRSKTNRRTGFVSEDMKQHLGIIHPAIQAHVRNEVIPSYKLIEEHDILKFRDWTPDALGMVIADVMTMARLDRRRIVQPEDLDRSDLSPEVLATADAYFTQIDLQSSMSPQLFSKHRGILLEKDMDIAEKLGKGRNKLTATGTLQLLYSKRWNLERHPDLAKLAVGAESIDGILASLARAPLADRSSPNYYNNGDFQ